MTPEKLDKLRELALAAQELHPGEWTPEPSNVNAFSAMHSEYPGLPSRYAGSMYPEWLREFVLAAQPSVVLELLDALDMAQREIDTLKDFLEKATEIPPNPLSRLFPGLLAPIEETEVVPDEPIPEGPPEVQVGDIVWYWQTLPGDPIAALLTELDHEDPAWATFEVYTLAGPSRRSLGWWPVPAVGHWTVRDPALLSKREGT